ncbi:hypothetical protein BDZ97DRAFT_1906406 [Flammula alnicola]|nr:hypothetical protein BDZ97DRAFT_1906406 [Flammula alnicola]
MGSAQSYISPEAAVTVLVVAGAVGLGYTQIGPSASNPSAPSVSSAPGTAKKGKKNKQTKAVGAPGDISETGSANKYLPPSEPRVVASEVIPGQFDPTPTATPEPPAQEATSASKVKKSKKKKGKAAGPEPVAQTVSSSVDYLSESSVKAKTKNTKRQQQEAPLNSSSSQLTRPLQQSTTSLDTDGSWTRVGSHRRGPAANDADSTPSAEPTTSDAAITPSVTGNSSPVAERGEDQTFLLNVSRDSGENRRTLAEKMLPKPRKTGVDDMLETSDYRTLSRVMRVQPLPNEQPATGFSWGDYEDVRVATDGGENDADGEDDGWGVVTSKRASTSPKGSGVPDETTRQNAQKRDAQKAEKAEGEAQRLARLAEHKRQLEKERMLEQFANGGMKAGIDERGKLIWE